MTAERLVHILLDSEDDDAMYAEYAKVAGGPEYTLRQALISGQRETVEVPSPSGGSPMTIEVYGTEYSTTSKLRFIRVSWTTGSAGDTIHGGQGAYRSDNVENIMAALSHLIAKFSAWSSPYSYTNYPVDEAYRKLIPQCWQPKHAKRGHSSHHFNSDLRRFSYLTRRRR